MTRWNKFLLGAIIGGLLIILTYAFLAWLEPLPTPKPQQAKVQVSNPVDNEVYSVPRSQLKPWRDNGPKSCIPGRNPDCAAVIRNIEEYKDWTKRMKIISTPSGKVRGVNLD
jgi:hypothetical protein